jgi:type I restriction enzyme S subunit
MTKKIKLSDLFKIGSSKRVLKAQWQTSGVPFYRGREITKLSQNGFVENDLFISEELYSEYATKHGVPTAGDIVITAIGTIGNSYIVREEDRFYFKDASVLWLKRNSDVESKYINLWLKSSLMKEQLDEGNGATVDTLTIKKLQGLTLKLPPLPEQKRIVAILDQAFADLKQVRAKTEQNLKNARELFDSYLQRVFSQKSEGWVTSSLKSITSKIGSGATPRGGSAAYKTEGMSLIRSMNVHDRLFKDEKLALIDDEQAEKLSNVELQANDVLLNITGASVARCCVVPEEYLPARVNQHVSIIRVNDNTIKPEFLCYLLTSKYYKEILLGIGEAGSTRQAITKVQIENFEVSYPESFESQDNFIKQLTVLENDILKLHNIYTQKLETIGELKNSILQKAFSGELTAKAE